MLIPTTFSFAHFIQSFQKSPVLKPITQWRANFKQPKQASQIPVSFYHPHLRTSLLLYDNRMQPGTAKLPALNRALSTTGARSSQGAPSSTSSSAPVAPPCGQPIHPFDDDKPMFLSSSNSSISSLKSGSAFLSQLRPSADLSQPSRQRHDQRMEMTAVLDKVLETMRGYCPVHFAAYDELHICASQPCDRAEPIVPWGNYMKFRTSFNFEAFTFCFLCGTPNDSSSKMYYQPHCHLNINPSACEWKHLVFKTLYVLWHRSDAARLNVFAAHNVPADISLVEFAQWSQEDLQGNMSPHYYNGLNMFISFCQWQSQTGLAFESMDIFPDL